MSTIARINKQVIQCRACTRLVEWREQVASEKRRRYMDWEYWGRPVPAFGDPNAKLLIIGLAPAAHGANRTGRMFTGDRSGEWLYRALHKAGFANQPESVQQGDGLELHNCFITALCRCAPPANKPTQEEFANCASFLQAELQIFAETWQEQKDRAAILCLGQLSFRHTLRRIADIGLREFRPLPAFAHGGQIELTEEISLFTSYHPSQQNTFTGKLTEPMFDAVFERIRGWVKK